MAECSCLLVSVAGDAQELTVGHMLEYEGVRGHAVHDKVRWHVHANEDAHVVDVLRSIHGEFLGEWLASLVTSRLP